MNRRRFLKLLGSATLASGIAYSFPAVIVPKNIARFDPMADGPISCWPDGLLLGSADLQITELPYRFYASSGQIVEVIKPFWRTYPAVLSREQIEASYRAAVDGWIP